MDFGSDRTRQDVVPNSEDFRSLLNSSNGENSVNTLDTVRLVNSEVSKRMDELKRDSNFQIIESINSAINEGILPSIQNTMTSQSSGSWKKWTTGPVDLTGPLKLKVLKKLEKKFKSYFG